jgi:hypothetical protein
MNNHLLDIYSDYLISQGHYATAAYYYDGDRYQKCYFL